MKTKLPYDFTKKKDIVKALELAGKEQKQLFKYAREVRSSIFGNKVESRSVIEYSNICEQECKYCGLHKTSGVKRYILKSENVLRRVERLYNLGRRVVMFQTGECHSDPYFNRLYSLLKEIKLRHKDLTIICCLGNLCLDKMKRLRDIGIERYLIKFETSNEKLYKKIKHTDALKERLKHLEAARKLGFQVSSGNIIGLPGQTLTSIAEDLLLLKRLDLPMVSNSVFIPNDMSEYSSEEPGDLNTALNATAILRILCPSALIPSTSSLETLKKGGQYLGLLAGANTITLHDGTPKEEEGRFILYKKNRVIPKNVLFDVAEDAGLTCPGYSLLRDSQENSLFHYLITKNIKQKNAAIIFEDKKYTYKQILSMTSRFSSFLEKKKITEGDTVLLSAYDSVDFIVAFLSSIRLGVKIGAVDPMLTKEEWKQTLKDINPKCVLTSGEIKRTLGDKRFIKITDAHSSKFFFSLLGKHKESKTFITPDANNTAIILFTSGTTGISKGVMHTYKDLFENAFPENILKLTHKDISLSSSRMHTSFGLGNSLLFPFAKGSSVILSRNIPNTYSLQNLLKHKPTLFFAVPSIYKILISSSKKLKPLFKSVRFFIASGEKLYEDLYSQWLSSFGKPLLECYGTTEMSHSFISNIPKKEKPGSCGKLLTGFGVKFSKSGRMFYRGPSLTMGYYNNPTETHRRLTKGWFKSDDIGHASRGKIYFDGRVNHIVKSGGKWISVLDIENILKSSPIVKDIAIIKQETELAYYVSLKKKMEPFLAEKKIRKYCLKHIKLNEFPGAVHILKDIPYTSSGKINRKRLKK